MEYLERRRLLVADLAIDSIDGDGDQLIVSYDIANQSVPPFDIGIYSSSDGTSADTLIQSIEVTASSLLAVGVGHSIAFDPSFSADYEGQFLVALLDCNTDVSESSETNNLAVLSEAVFINNYDDSLHIHGSGSADTIDVVADSTPDVDLNSLSYSYSSAFSAVNVIAHGGDDDVDASLSTSQIIAYGSAGSDWIASGSAHDSLFGGVGDDSLESGDGNDYAYGGDGIDSLFGGNGNDELIGGMGDDHLFGESGSDELNGESGGDSLEGGSGSDTLIGGLGDDWLFGGDDGDYLDGSGGADYLYGEDGGDVAYGGAGADFISGGEGDDNLNGDGGSDVIYGDAGSDNMYGGAGDDYLLGDTTEDTISDTLGTNEILAESANAYGGGDIPEIVSFSYNATTDKLEGDVEDDTDPTDYLVDIGGAISKAVVVQTDDSFDATVGIQISGWCFAFVTDDDDNVSKRFWTYIL